MITTACPALKQMLFDNTCPGFHKTGGFFAEKRSLLAKISIILLQVITKLHNEDELYWTKG